MRSSLRRIVTPVLCAGLLGQGGCAALRQAPLAEGGADDVAVAEFVLPGDVCLDGAGAEGMPGYPWRIYGGTAEGGMLPVAPGDPDDVMAEGGEDGFFTPGPLPWRDCLAGVWPAGGGVAAWVPFGGEAGADGEARLGDSLGEAPPGGGPVAVFLPTVWPAWPGTRGGVTTGGIGDPHQAGPTTGALPGPPRPEDGTLPLEDGELLVVGPPPQPAPPPAVMPEPGTLALLCAALAALGLLRRPV